MNQVVSLNYSKEKYKIKKDIKDLYTYFNIYLNTQGQIGVVTQLGL